ncbi:MAG TPA: PD-(D/E)XK nuclease family protein [Planctomycetaceae bacterium]|nr:PD-(D/E)XK nuclease family protein [Planctomycetaceae bacterium]HIQ20515.1 PD-(D/E)XK nuclease family protein [Planctomycetota bacterium]
MNGEAVAADHPRSAHGGVWDYLSASRLLKWLNCPLAFKFQYIDGLRPPATPSQLLGKVVHRALEILHRHRQLHIPITAGELCGRLPSVWDEVAGTERAPFSSQAERAAREQDAARLVAAYLAQMPPEETPMAVEMVLEAPLVDPRTGEDLGMPLLGILDLVTAEENGTVIVDFKTAARTSEPVEILHEIQLTCYAYLLRAAADQREAALEIRTLVKTKTPKILRHRYPTRSAGHFARLFAVVREYLEALDRRRFTFRPGLACSMCAFRQTACPKWSG